MSAETLKTTGAYVKASNANEMAPAEYSYGNNHDGAHWVWLLSEDNIPPVPRFHPMEKSSNTIPGIPSKEVSTRISNFLRINSIASVYAQDLPRVECVTPTMVKFLVQLWRTVPSGRERGGDIVVEIQRRQGCSVEMHRVCGALFNAIMTGDMPFVTGDSHVQEHHASDVLREAYEPGKLRTYADSRSTGSHSMDSLMITVGLLESAHPDQMLLGMESVCILTNPRTVVRADAVSVSRLLLLGEGDYGQRLHAAVLSYFNSTKCDEVQEMEEEYYDSDDEDDMEYAQGSNFWLMHHLALQALSNALEVIPVEGTDSSQLDLDSAFWSHVIPALVYDLEIATRRPHEASLSALCLRHLSRFLPQVMGQTLGLRLLPALMNANEYGKARHLSLERESRKLMELLSTVR